MLIFQGVFQNLTLQHITKHQINALNLDNKLTRVGALLFKNRQNGKSINRSKADQRSVTLTLFRICDLHFRTNRIHNPDPNFRLICDPPYNSLHLGRKYARILVRGHYLFRYADSFPRAKLEKNCELRGTDNVQGQISEHIFSRHGGYCLYYCEETFIYI